MRVGIHLRASIPVPRWKYQFDMRLYGPQSQWQRKALQPLWESNPYFQVVQLVDYSLQRPTDCTTDDEGREY